MDAGLNGCNIWNYRFVPVWYTGQAGFNACLLVCRIQKWRYEMKIVDKNQYLELSLKYELRIITVYEDYAIVKFIKRKWN